MREDHWMIGIHGSVEELFPPSVLREELSGVNAAIEIVNDNSNLSRYDAIVTFDYSDAFLSAGLEWIHCVLAGVDEFPLEELRQESIQLTNSSGIHGDAVGETALGYMLQFARRLHIYRDHESGREWQYPEWDEAFTLSDESVCIVGLGTLGRAIASRADAIGMDVVGVRRTPTPITHVDEIYTPDSLTEAVAEARFVVLTVPLNPHTRGLIGTDELAAMREDAFLVNVARGPVVQQDVLIRELKADRLAGAALDVFETEPLPDDSPLWGMENAIVTPHAAAANQEYSRRVATLVEENIKRLQTGDSLANQVV